MPLSGRSIYGLIPRVFALRVTALDIERLFADRYQSIFNQA